MVLLMEKGGLEFSLLISAVLGFVEGLQVFQSVSVGYGFVLSYAYYVGEA